MMKKKHKIFPEIKMMGNQIHVDIYVESIDVFPILYVYISLS